MVIKVDSKSGKVDLSQRDQEERAAEKKLADKGAGTINTAGMTPLGAALARAGIKKNNFVDLSKVCHTTGIAALLPQACWASFCWRTICNLLFKFPIIIHIIIREYALTAALPL